MKTFCVIALLSGFIVNEVAAKPAPYNFGCLRYIGAPMLGVTPVKKTLLRRVRDRRVRPLPSCTCSLTVLTGGTYDPPCPNDHTCTPGGTDTCNYCVTFAIRNDGTCCISSFDIHPHLAGYCFTVCGATDVPTHPSWNQSRNNCSTFPTTLTSNSVCTCDAPHTGLCPGQTILMRICETASGSTYDITGTAPDGTNCTVSATP